MIVTFEVFAANVEMRVFWGVGTCILIGICEGFAGTCCLYFADRKPIRWAKNTIMYNSIFFTTVNRKTSRSRWPCGLWCRPVAAQMLGKRFRILLRAWIFASHVVCCADSGLCHASLRSPTRCVCVCVCLCVSNYA